jgi:hypothetical protein
LGWLNFDYEPFELYKDVKILRDMREPIKLGFIMSRIVAFFVKLSKFLLLLFSSGFLFTVLKYWLLFIVIRKLGQKHFCGKF